MDIKKNPDRYGETSTILNAFTSAGIVPKAAYTSDDIETSILAVAAGVGYALLPSYITDHISMKEMVIAVPIEGEEKKITIIAGWRKENSNPALRKFLSEYVLPAIEGQKF